MSNNTRLAELMNYITVDTTSGVELQVSGRVKQSAVTSAILKASSTGVLSAATAGTDYLTSVGISNLTATGTPSSTTYLRGDNTWATISLGGTLPVGGTAGQILSKINGTDYNTQWIDNFANQLKQDVKLGATLSKGTPVYVSDANGTNMIVSAASNTAEVTSSKTMGLLETGGVLNDIVKVVTEGFLSGLDTSAATIGNPVWLGTSGTLLYGVANKPVAPAHMVFIGIVTRVSATVGEIFVKVQNGFEIEELHNVLITSVTNNDGLFYDSATSLWKNKSITAALGYTPYNSTNPNNYIALTALSSTATGLTYTNTTGVFSLTSGYSIPTTSSQTNWDTAYTNRITSLTTTGSSGAATLSANTLNIPNYTLSGLGGQASSTNLTSLSGLTYVSASFVKMTAAGTFSLDTNTYYLASNPSGYTNNTGTVTSVSALTLGTTGTDLSSSVATGTTTPVITLNVPSASATNRGVLTSADWTTFNNKQGAITLTTTGSSGAATFATNTLNIPNYTLAGLGGQASSTNLTSLSGLTYASASFVKMTASGTFSLDTNTYASTSALASYLPLAGGTMTGQIVSSFAEAIKLTQGSGYIAGYNAAGTTRQGYIQWTNGNAYFAAEASSNLVLMTQGSNRVSINTAGDLSVLYGSYFSGTINTYATQAIKMNANSCYIGGFDTAGTTRYGYLQFASGSLNLASEAGAALNLISNSTTRIYVTPAGNTGMGTTSPLSMLHLYGGTLTVNSSGTTEIGGGMRIISHTKRTVNSTKFIKIYAGTNNYFTGFIYYMNFDDYPVGSATSTGSGGSIQFGGYSDGAGSHGDKYMDSIHFGGNNVGGMGREMNTDGNGYIITATTSTGAGGFKCSATIFLFARDMSQVVISYY